jgi:hypothetical protein
LQPAPQNAMRLMRCFLSRKKRLLTHLISHIPILRGLKASLWHKSSKIAFFQSDDKIRIGRWRQVILDAQRLRQSQWESPSIVTIMQYWSRFTIFRKLNAMEHCWVV